MTFDTAARAAPWIDDASFPLSVIPAVTTPEPPAAPVTMIEKRDPSGRLLARVGMAGGRLEGPCLLYAEDGETVVSEMLFRDGQPVPPAPPRLLGMPVAGEASF